jgi:hypothetical protein
LERATRHLLTAETERLRQEGVEVDEVLHRLRDRGCSKGQSVLVLAGLGEFAGPSRLAQAKKLVHESPAWAHVKERDEAIFGALGEVIEGSSLTFLVVRSSVVRARSSRR